MTGHQFHNYLKVHICSLKQRIPGTYSFKGCTRSFLVFNQCSVGSTQFDLMKVDDWRSLQEQIVKIIVNINSVNR